jgi:peptide/nickel transport system permease protein
MVGETGDATVQGGVLRLPTDEAATRPGLLAPSRLLRLMQRKPLGVAAILVLVVLWGACLLAPLMSPFGYDQLFTAPRLSPPSAEHWFGTDESGRDVLSRLLYGGRLSLTLSLAATAGGVALAVLFGVTSGYAAGWPDLAFQRLSDAVQALPTLIVLLVLAALFRGDPVIVLIAVALLFAPFGGRLFRSGTLALREQPFVEAARVVDASPLRIVLVHIMPNIYPLIIVVTTSFVGFNLLLLATLSFLGFINADYPDWGTMLNLSAANYMVSAPWLVLAPGAAITLSVLAYNLLGDSLRDILDPRLRGS